MADDDESWDIGESVFLSEFTELWTNLMIWTVLVVGLVFFGSGVVACRVGKSRLNWLWLPLAMGLLGAAIGFVQGAIPAVMIAALYSSIPYEVGIDIAAGLGISQAIVIVYFQMGRADFIHR